MIFDISFSSGALSPSRYGYEAFKPSHDSATTAPEIEGLLGRSSMPVDEFSRLRILAEPCVCVKIGCESVLEGFVESGKPVRVKFEDSGSEG